MGSLNNFNFLRIVCAYLVFYEHSFPLFTGSFASFDLCKIFFSYRSGSVGVFIFFCISGYLVSKSYQTSSNIIQYFLKRILRVFPALLVVTCMSVLFFSSLSSLGFKAYISHDLTLLFFQNSLILKTYYYLPGVFETNIFGSSINGSLWSIPYEFICYMFLCVVFILNIIKFMFIYLLSILLFIFFHHHYIDQIDKFILSFFLVNLKAFYLPFLFFNLGIIYYIFEEKITFNIKNLSVVCILLLAVNFDLIPRIMNVFSISFLTFYVANLNLNILQKLRRIPDISYGFYLYAFPIQQTFSHFFSQKWLFEVLFISSLLTTILFASFSWYLVEKPALGLKRKWMKNK